MSGVQGLHAMPSPLPGLRVAEAPAAPPRAKEGASTALPRITILLADADSAIADTLAAQLLADGYDPVVARSSQHARALAEMRQPRLAIFGELENARATLELLEEVRSPASISPPQARSHPRPDLPVIVLCSGAHELDLLRAFEAGADDFLARPPRYLELRARVQALLRRAGHEHRTTPLLQVAGLVLDLDARVAHLHGRRLQLRRMEYELLAQLASAPDRVFSKRDLLFGIWGYKAACTTRTLDSHASRLRRKLSALDARPWVVNVRGVGYRLL